jgi:hypothetical protein
MQASPSVMLATTDALACPAYDPVVLPPTALNPRPPSLVAEIVPAGKATSEAVAPFHLTLALIASAEVLVKKEGQSSVESVTCPESTPTVGDEPLLALHPESVRLIEAFSALVVPEVMSGGLKAIVPVTVVQLTVPEAAPLALAPARAGSQASKAATVASTTTARREGIFIANLLGPWLSTSNVQAAGTTPRQETPPRAKGA